jgi:hypothetical protein
MGGACVGLDIYSMKWDIACIAPRYRDLMERQVCIHLAGGIAEAIHRGVRHEVLRFAASNCEMDATWSRREPCCAICGG